MLAAATGEVNETTVQRSKSPKVEGSKGAKQKECWDVCFPAFLLPCFKHLDVSRPVTR